MSDNNLYPWLESHWQQLLALKQQFRLPHALMIKGIDGLGIEQLAMVISHSLLCQSPTEQGFACETCSDCKLVQAGSHPDLHQISVAADKKYISVDQIRELVNICQQRPHQGGYRVAVIQPAESMNMASANAMLKTLEEPGSDTLIILVSSDTNMLPATIRSRCRLISIYPPAEDAGLDWLMGQQQADRTTSLQALRLSAYAPLKAQNLLSSDQLKLRQKIFTDMEKATEGRFDPVQIVASIGKFDYNQCIDWLYSLALDTQKYKLQISADKLVNSDQINLLKKMSSSSGSKLNSWIDQILEARRVLATSSNINPQLLLEDLMFRWIAIFK